MPVFAASTTRAGGKALRDRLLSGCVIASLVFTAAVPTRGFSQAVITVSPIPTPVTPAWRPVADATQPVPQPAPIISMPASSAGAPTPVPVPMGGPMNMPTSVTASPSLRAGLWAADRRDWNGVRDVMAALGPGAPRELLLWELAVGGNASFMDLDLALRTLTRFPDRRTIRIRAEQAVANSGIGPQATRDFLMRVDPGTGAIGPGPISGEGKFALGEAMIALGDLEQATYWIRSGWREHRLDVPLQAAYLARYGSYLRAEDHDARVDFLLWADRRTQARPLLGLMTPQGRTNAGYRLDIAAGRGAVLRGEAIDDRSITFERVRQLRASEDYSQAVDLMVRIDPTGLPLTASEALWRERRILTNEAMKLRRYQDAYKIASGHGFRSGAEFADGEFLSGWIALRFLNQPDVAARHFKTLQEGVGSAVSLSRGWYWRGRAAEALGQRDEALEFYREAAAHFTFYYGQLGALRLAEMTGRQAVMRLPPQQRATAADRAALLQDPYMQLLAEVLAIGDEGLFQRLALSFDDGLGSEREHQALSEWARELGLPVASIRIAKAGINRKVIATEAAFPLVRVPRLQGYGQIEDAYTLAIARQESEFNPNARSHANALGLMQFLPATAASQARRMGLDHQTAWLTARPEHALVLGSAHLYDLAKDFNGSYIMTAAAYNAGPGRPARWVGVYGDPRARSLDEVIDWVEMVPFSETRNYIQRVLENIQVYRARLNNDEAPLGLASDLVRGTPGSTFAISVRSGSQPEPDLPAGPEDAPPAQ
jgi:soluble lytic murein transglycosylase